MFNYREYIKKAFIEAIGSLADYQIRLNSAGYFDKGVLTEEDLQEIEVAIVKKNTPPVIEDIPIIEPIEENISSIPPLVRTIK